MFYYIPSPSKHPKFIEVHKKILRSFGMCIPHWFLCISQVPEALMASFQRFGTWEVSASHLGKEPFAKSWKKSFLPKKLKAGLVDLVKDRSDIFAIALPNETYICCPPSELNPGEAGGYLSDSCLTVIPSQKMQSDAMPRYAKWTMVILPRNWKGSHSDLNSNQNEAQVCHWG